MHDIRLLFHFRVRSFEAIDSTVSDVQEQTGDSSKRLGQRLCEGSGFCRNLSSLCPLLSAGYWQPWQDFDYLVSMSLRPVTCQVWADSPNPDETIGGRLAVREEGWGQSPKVSSAWWGGESQPLLTAQRSQQKEVGGAPAVSGPGDSD